MGLHLNAFATGGAALTTETCCNCGVAFAMDTALYQQRRKDHASFYCPNGHSQYYTGQTDEQKRIAELERAVELAKRETESARHSRQWAESRAKGANIAAGLAKAAARRLRRRVEAGVCPDCHRTFKQLAAHMKCKHGKGQ